MSFDPCYCEHLNQAIVPWTLCFHYGSCSRLQSTHFKTTHYSNTHDSRTQGTGGEKGISHQPIRTHHSDKDIAHHYGFLIWIWNGEPIPKIQSPPISYLLFHHWPSQPSSSSGQIMVTNTLGHRKLSTALIEWIGLVIPVTKRSVYKLDGYSLDGLYPWTWIFLCKMCWFIRKPVPLLFPAVILFSDPSPKLPNHNTSM